MPEVWKRNEYEGAEGLSGRGSPYAPPYAPGPGTSSASGRGSEVLGRIVKDGAEGSGGRWYSPGPGDPGSRDAGAGSRMEKAGADGATLSSGTMPPTEGRWYSPGPGESSGWRSCERQIEFHVSG